METVLHLGITAISLILSLLATHWIGRHRVFSFLNERSGRFGSLDGLRGFLALSIFYHHYVVTWYWKASERWARPPEVYFENIGKASVALFFMITGFLFTAKILRQRKTIDWLKLYESRIYRIMPLYLIMVAIILFIVFYNTHFTVNIAYGDLFKQVLGWTVFHGPAVNDFADTRIINSGVDWTLRYEWLFYLSLPILAVGIIYGSYYFGIALLIACGLAYFYPVTFLYYSTKFFILLACGGVVAYLAHRYTQILPMLRTKAAAAFLLFLIAFITFYPHTFDPIHIIAITVLFMIVAAGNSLFGLFTSRASIVLGEISYSIYLLHGITLYLTFTSFKLVDPKALSLDSYLIYMPLVSLILVPVSALSFAWVEKPFMARGRRYAATQWLRNQMNNAGRFKRKKLPS